MSRAEEPTVQKNLDTARRLQRMRRDCAGSAGQALVLAAKARALMLGRLAVTRDDIAAMLLPVLAHRVLRNFEAEADGVAIADILAALHAGIRAE